MKLKTMNFNIHLLLGAFLLFFIGCVPEEKEARCGTGETYSLSLRRCIASVDYSDNNQPIMGPDQAVAGTEDGGGIAFTLSAATDADGDTLSYTSVTTPANGALTDCMAEAGSSGSTDRTCTFLPNANFAGTESFTYRVFDGKEYSVTQATVTFTIAAIDDPATISGSATSSGNEDVPILISGIVIDEGGGSDEDTQTMTVTVTTDNATLTPDADIDVYYNSVLLGQAGAVLALGDTGSANAANIDLVVDPGTDQNGVSNITISVDDGSGAVTLVNAYTVSAVDDDPDFVATTAGTTTVNEDVGVATIAKSYTVDEGGSTDEDGQDITVTVTSSDVTLIPQANIDIEFYDTGLAAYEAALDATASRIYNTVAANVVAATDLSSITDGVRISFEPAANQNGTATLTVQISDGTNTATDTISVTVNAVDDSPTINAGVALAGVVTCQASTTEDTTLSGCSFAIDEGGITDEDSQSLQVKVTSGDQAVIPDTGIKIDWNGSTLADPSGTVNTSALIALSDGATSGDAGNIALEFSPAANASGAAVITVETFDGTNTTTDTFTVTVTAVNDAGSISNLTYGADTNMSTLTTNEATLVDDITFTIDEGGGTDEDTQCIAIVVDTDNATLVPENSSNIKINYNGAQLAGAMVGTGNEQFLDEHNTFEDDTTDSAASSVTMDLVPVAGQTGTANLTITVSEYSDAIADGGNGDTICTTGDALLGTVTKAFAVTVTNVSAIHNDWSLVKAEGAVVDNGGTQLVAQYATVSWNAMTMFNDTISGYNVYRADYANSDPDNVSNIYSKLNATALSSGTLTYTDSTVTNAKAYWYKVKPISSSATLVTDTSENYTAVRVIVPPNNKVFVNRRIANAEICGKMGQTVDATDFNDCDFTGPGAVGGKFDLGTDLIVDKFEAGCPYTNSPGTECTSTGNGCIGTTDPDTAITATAGSIYYERDTAICYINTDGATAWSEMQAANPTGAETFVASISNAHQPPLVNVNQADGHSICSNQSVSVTGLVVGTPRLMTRQDFIIASAWDTSIDDSTINSNEIGSDLSSSTSRCNSSTGGSLTFSNSEVPVTALADSLPGTASSSIRSVRTGSDATASCESMYGARDMVGNVREWMDNRITCSTTSGGNYYCAANTSGISTNSRIVGNSAEYVFDGTIASCTDSDGSTCADDDALTAWTLSAESFDSGKFQMNIGMPALSATATTGVLDIGTTITSTQLHGDSISINANTINTSGAGNVGGMTSGGSYDQATNTGSADNAGRYSSEFLPIDNTTTYEISSETGFRCAVPVSY